MSEVETVLRFKWWNNPKAKCPFNNRGDPVTLATLVSIAKIATATAVVVGTGATISAQQSAKKRAKGQAEQAERVRIEERTRMAETTKKAEALAVQAEQTKTTAIGAWLKRKRRATIATGPRGLFGEPEVTKPTLLGS